METIGYDAKPDDAGLSTAVIQCAIDACSSSGGGVVRIPKGSFRCGGLTMRSHVTLALEAGACLLGSSDCRDYGTGSWGDALIQGDHLEHVAIVGEGTIDGADCRRPGGEEGFRGPHAIRFGNVSHIAISGVTIQHAGNYAVFCTNSSDVSLNRVVIRGGHDGVHAQGCSNVVVDSCDFRTGDDAVAGCDNRNFQITGSAFNSSCNAFRFGCDGMTMERCRIWGPGEHAHQVHGRTAQGTAFVHFSPRDRNPQLPSDNWVIRDTHVDNVQHLYVYEHGSGIWQEGQPVKRIRFERVTGTRLREPIRIVGDATRQMCLTLDDVTLAVEPDEVDQTVIDIAHFGQLALNRVTLRNAGQHPVLRCSDGQAVELRDVTILPANHPNPFEISGALCYHTHSTGAS